MTAVLPPRPTTIGDDQLIAWAANHQARDTAAYADGYEAGRQAGYEQALRDIARSAAFQRGLTAGKRRGYQQALHDVAVRAIELDLTNADEWAAARREALARSRRRRDDMEAAAQQRYAAEGRPEYRGGVVPVWGDGDAA